MREKTIKAVIAKKIKDWMSSIDDPVVRKLVRDHTVITGGCFTSLIQNQQPNDYDVYFRTRDVAIEVAKYYCRKFNDAHGPIENGVGKTVRAVVIDGKKIRRVDDEVVIAKDQKDLIDVLGDNTYRIGQHTDGKFGGMSRMVANTADTDRVKVFVASDGVAGDAPAEEGVVDEGVDLARKLEGTLSKADEVDVDNGEGKEKKSKEVKTKYRPVFLSTNAISLSDDMQIVVRFWGEPQDIHETYDFEHCKAYWTSWEREVVIPASVYEAVINKTLVYAGSKYPICSLFRLRKFIGRGWTINAGQILKIAWQVSELDLTDIDVLEDQLIGVDSVYFVNLIEQLRKQRDENPGWAFSQGYVVSIIDKIF
jgi:hypothetical protein